MAAGDPATKTNGSAPAKKNKAADASQQPMANSKKPDARSKASKAAPEKLKSEATLKKPVTRAPVAEKGAEGSTAVADSSQGSNAESFKVRVPLPSTAWKDLKAEVARGATVAREWRKVVVAEVEKQREADWHVGADPRTPLLVLAAASLAEIVAAAIACRPSGPTVRGGASTSDVGSGNDSVASIETPLYFAESEDKCSSGYQAYALGAGIVSLGVCLPLLFSFFASQSFEACSAALTPVQEVVAAMFEPCRASKRGPATEAGAESAETAGGGKPSAGSDSAGGSCESASQEKGEPCSKRVAKWQDRLMRKISGPTFLGLPVISLTALFLLLWWAIAATLLTCIEPFADSLSNGFVACWIGLIAAARLGRECAHLVTSPLKSAIVAARDPTNGHRGLITLLVATSAIEWFSAALALSRQTSSQQEGFKVWALVVGVISMAACGSYLKCSPRVDASPEALHSFATFIAGWWLQALIFSFEPSVHLGSTNGTVSARATCITCTSPDPRAC